MKKILISILFALMALSSIPSYGQAKWTFMVYLDADCDLEPYGLLDFLEMATVGSTNDVNILVQMDRIQKYTTEYENWTTVKRFRITKGMTPIAANALEDMGELNMGDPKTLSDFITWGVSSYPAENYAVVLWNHGAGWRTLPPMHKGVCYDESSDNDYLRTAELKQALDDCGTKLSIIAFDACLMGMIEVAHEIRNNASVMVASEETEPGDGWPYDPICSWLVSNPDATASSLGSKIVDLYYDSYSTNGSKSVTQSALDLSQIETLSNNIGTLATTIDTDSTDTDSIKAAAKTVMTQISDNVVINSRCGGSVDEAYGVAINFPPSGISSDYTDINLDFVADTPSWKSFLINFSKSYSSGWLGDARKDSQKFYNSKFVDIYDFCLNVSNSDGEKSGYNVTIGSQFPISAAACSGITEFQKKPKVWATDSSGKKLVAKVITKFYPISSVTCEWKKRCSESTYDFYVQARIPGSKLAPVLFTEEFNVVRPEIDASESSAYATNLRIKKDVNFYEITLNLKGKYFGSKKPKIYYYYYCPVKEKYMKKRFSVKTSNPMSNGTTTGESELTAVGKWIPSGASGTVEMENKISRASISLNIKQKDKVELLAR